MPRQMILDCDPGIDDALALVFAAGHPGLRLRGVTTVAGNVGLDQTTANALRVLEFLGLTQAPVTPGCPGPLLRPAIDARAVHGADGLAGARLPAAASAARGGHAVDYLIEEIDAAPGEITLVATGPLTNVALAVRRHPPLVGRVRDFVIMGGSASRGNVTPAAEFNIATDPEAAAIVFRAGWTVTMVGLDVTLQARAGAAVLDRMRDLGPLADELLLPMLSRYQNPAAQLPAHGAVVPGGATVAGDAVVPDGPAVHDVCAVALVAEPRLIRCLPARVEVETAGRLTSGMTVTDFAAAPAERNALVAVEIDTIAFWDLVLETYRRVASRIPAAAASLPGAADN
jgi:purine nucleosidase